MLFQTSTKLTFGMFYKLVITVIARNGINSDSSILHCASCTAQNERPQIPRTRYYSSIHGPGKEVRYSLALERAKWPDQSVVGLAIPNATPWDTVNIKKEIYRIFNHNGLRITIEANKQTINFLDVTFNLNKSTYLLFTKTNTTLHYVHRESNHLPITTKNIPAGINKRLSSLSINKASFDQAVPLYQKALYESGYLYTVHYEPPTTNKRRNRKRNNILWYP